MRQHPERTTRLDRAIHATVATVAGLLCTLLAVPAQAQSATVQSQSSWVMATLASVSTVVLLWGVALLVFRLARRFRWVAPHRHGRISRALQVTFGGLLLLSVFMPYLALHHPAVAVGLILASILWIYLCNCNQSLSGGETSPPSG
ncbi:MAG: hypothetical protein ACOCV2_09630 [Persicimonas sp.]